MDGSRDALLHGPLFSRRDPLDRNNAASRISAYVYGNILVLAALIPVTTTAEHVGILVVVGTALSTFVAHTFAEGVGQGVRENRPLTPQQRWEELRDSMPILSSAVLPSIILACAAVDWLAPHTAQIVAEVAMLVRIGGIVFVIERLKGARPGRSTVLSALLLTAVATTVVVVKVVLTH
ncbi:hypothetical protein C5E45_22290 [Nocardia nova]|uniref:Integral membrane protein n=1 Tax=Nocardia nova TaxID=37330 RepID=A0A2S6ALM1_9NOCA|nr:hypothetical protein [Nocardia nova]PPJ26959.1 hypothetical protein C5E41_16925 [Nocardia nova]PPJ36128.1 hypothetical protein C5E45_22290 [Nocardia nova]